MKAIIESIISVGVILLVWFLFTTGDAVNAVIALVIAVLGLSIIIGLEGGVKGGCECCGTPGCF